MATFDNQGGLGDGTWEDANNWEPVGVPGNGAVVTIDADCVVSTDYSAIAFAGFTINAGKTLTPSTGAIIRFYNSANVYGTVDLDGGEIRFVHSGSGAADTFHIRPGGKMVGTGTFSFDVAGVGKAYISIWYTGYILADSAYSIAITNIGFVQGGVIQMYGEGAYIKWVDIQDCMRIYYTRGIGKLIGCKIHATTETPYGTGFWSTAGAWLIAEDCYIYNVERGITGSGNQGRLILRNCVFGKDELGNAAPNTSDIRFYRDSSFSLYCYNVEFASTLFLSVNQVGGLGGRLCFFEFRSNVHDKDPEQWYHYEGQITIQGAYSEVTASINRAMPELGAGAQGGSGTAVKCMTSPYAATGPGLEYMRLVAVIPASDGDVIDATLYIKGTDTKTCTIYIDPFGMFGTTQSYAETADGNWNQRTIPQYTANTGGGEKIAVPIYIKFDGATETWFYDSLGWQIT